MGGIDNEARVRDRRELHRANLRSSSGVRNANLEEDERADRGEKAEIAFLGYNLCARRSHVWLLNV